MTKAPTGVRRVCSTQTEVRVFSNSLERWHYLCCPIIVLSDASTEDWIDRQTTNVMEALSRIERAAWVTDDAFKEVIEQLYNAEALVPYKYRVTFTHPTKGDVLIL